MPRFILFEGWALFLAGAALTAMLAGLAPPAHAATEEAAPPEPSLGSMTMGFTYFNRPGADLKTHDADVADCAAEGARTISADEQMHNGSNQGLVGLMVGGAIQSAAHRGAAAAGLENCMVVRGWRVVKLPDDEGKALAGLAPADLSARLSPWIGADEPHGLIVRTWENDAANAAHKRFSVRPDHTNGGQLSLIEATSSDLHQFKQAGQPIDSSRDVLDPKWPKGALASQKLSSAPSGASILMVQIKGLGFRNGIGVVLNRVGTEADISPSHSDHGPDRLMAIKGLLFAHKSGDMFAFAVPPGRWRVQGLVGGLLVLNFCLGAPSFEVGANEVVYAGSFDLSAADIGPDLDLAAAKAWLGARPETQTVRPAIYVNGSRGVCGDNAIYALEIKGAPFESGYAWGGAAQGARAGTTGATAPAPGGTIPSPTDKAPAATP